MSSRSAFDKGKLAASAGATVEDNPYPEGSGGYFKWLHGLAEGLSEIVTDDPPLDVSLQ